MSTRAELIGLAETEWLARWSAGPTEEDTPPLPTGTSAPDLVLEDHDGTPRALSEFWHGGPALLMFWRHFGCGCGFERAARLRSELELYTAAGLNPVIIGQGEPVRAAAYRAEHQLPVTVLCDPEHIAYRAYGVGHWQIERVLPDAPPEFWDHPHDAGAAFQTQRRAQGQPLVDDPWRAVKEFVVGANGRIRLTYAYQYCENYPAAQLLATAALLS